MQLQSKIIFNHTNYNLYNRKGMFMSVFFNNLDWIILIKSFVIGGLICVVGQILIDKTKLTPARILVIFVTTGVILGRSWNLSKIS